MSKPAAWPVLTRYQGPQLARVAMPLGGIGTGTVSLGGRGDLRDWEVMNRPAKGYIPTTCRGRVISPFFALYAKTAGGTVVTRALEGPLDLSEYEGCIGSLTPNHGLPRFRDCKFSAAYPLAQVELADRGVPLQVRLEAFNPLIPGDPERSGLPVAVLRYVLHNPSDKPVTAAICGSLPNFVGVDGARHTLGWGRVPRYVGAQRNRNTFDSGAGIRGLRFDSTGVAKDAEAWGTIALATTARAGISHRTAWADLSWGDTLLDFWDDFSADGAVDERRSAVDAPLGSLCVRTRIPPGGERRITFLLGWHFPNRYTWGHSKSCCDGGVCAADLLGNYYTEQFSDAWDAVERVAATLPQLEAETVRFVATFCASDLPQTVKEAALYNLSTLRTQTCFRTPDGNFYGYEGCHDKEGCCDGSCTHVWNYEQALAFLFGGLSRRMRRIEFAHATSEEGMMAFRVHLPLARGPERGYGRAAADGQMGCLMKLYRDWQMSGDDGLLRELWPAARKALAFCWLPGSWDADCDGVMEGCQHNTMDVEYYGPNPQMGSWYLGALRAAEEMARYLGEVDFAEDCRDLFERGSAWIDAHLFNGEYYEQEVRPAVGEQAIHPALRVGMGTDDLENPALQLGAGCLVDQLVGQYMAHVCGLGYLLDRQHVRRTLRSIMTYNRRTDFHGHFNHMRSYVLGDERALLMASYPRGRRPTRPFPYFSEVMTGFEYTAAVGMLYEGQTRNGLQVIRDIRARYDGEKRNPFDEAECGHHYARAMASWAAVPALTGFRYSGVAQALTLAPNAGRWFWASGDAWGEYRLQQQRGKWLLAFTVLHGELTIETWQLAGVGAVAVKPARRLRNGRTLELRIAP